MKHKRFLLAILIALMTAPGVWAQEAGTVITRESAPSPDSFSLASVGTGYDRPLLLTHADDGSNRVFVVTQGGRIFVIQPGETPAGDGQPTGSVFLDVTTSLTWDANAGGYAERGLLGLAFHPNYEDNGLFYINYTDRDGASVLARYSVSPDDPNMANIESGEILMKQPQPFGNHNGGHLAFGPDGYLYMALGDGGSADDPLASGQNPNTLLGTIVRIDIDSEAPYAVPSNNPFVNGGGAPEVWAYGLRNPWRFSFDRDTGDMYVADVGQNQYEEINFEPAGSPGGVNYGWNGYEATHVFNQSAVADNAVMPILEYDHSQGCSVTGGYVYRGALIPDLAGVYFYGDWCTGNVWAAYRDADMNWLSEVLITTGRQISSFGQDEQGELYLIDYAGEVLRFERTNP